MMMISKKPLGLVLLCAAVPGLADDAALARCRKIAEAAQRLACYDAIALAGPVAAPASAPAVTPAPPRQGAELDFGAPAKPPQIEFIESTLAEETDGWGANTRFRLANGQVWQVADDSSGFLRPGVRKVRVRRGAFGAFYIEFEDSNRSPRVRRVQ
jgi:hypothetical protein